MELENFSGLSSTKISLLAELRAVARLKTALRCLGQFFSDARRRFTLRLILIILPLAQAAGDLGALFKGQRGNRSLDFSDRAHVGKLSARRFGVSAPKLDLAQRRKGAEKVAGVPRVISRFAIAC
jgi:hypothetical protein